MRYLENNADKRERGFCVYCGAAPETRDHIPSKVLLDDPFPTNLHVVEACNPCNNGFSSDEEYLACFLECVLSGGTEDSLLKRERIKKILRNNEVLRTRLEKAKKFEAGQVSFAMEYERAEKVIMKLARGHAASESSIAKMEKPVSKWILPLHTLSESEFANFESEPHGDLFPEVGSRALERAVLGEDGWIIVQDGIYRFQVVPGPVTMVRLVLGEYLAAEIVWDESDLDAIQSFRRTLMQTEHTELDEFVGCTEEEISELEKNWNIKLPVDYRDFLKVMGRCAGEWDTASVWLFDELPDARRMASNALEEARDEGKTDFELSKDVFVFRCGSGDNEDGDEVPEILFFYVGKGKDASVYSFQFDGEPEKIASTFSDWLKEQEEILQEIDSLS